MSDAKCSKTGYGGPSLGEAPLLARQRLCKAIDDLRHAVCRAVFLIALLPTAATASADPNFPLARRYCTTCHGLEPLSYQRHTIAGWWLQVQRMRWINGAAAPGEAVLPLARELAAAYPAAGPEALQEYATMALPALVLTGLIFWRWQRNRRPRTKSPL